MQKWGFVFFLLAVASGILAVSDPNVTTGALAQMLFFGNVVLFVVFTLLGAMTPRAVEGSLRKHRGDA